MAAINKKVCIVAVRVYYCLQVDKWSNQNEKIRINNHCPRAYRVRRVTGGDGVMSKWTIHNNDKPLRELSDEQAAQLFNAWRKGDELQYRSEDGFSRSLGGFTSNDAIYRIKPKSERDEFVGQCKKLYESNVDIFAAIFDAIQRGDIKAPEVVK